MAQQGFWHPESEGWSLGQSDRQTASSHSAFYRNSEPWERRPTWVCLLYHPGPRKVLSPSLVWEARPPPNSPQPTAGSCSQGCPKIQARLAGDSTMLFVPTRAVWNPSRRLYHLSPVTTTLLQGHGQAPSPLSVVKHRGRPSSPAWRSVSERMAHSRSTCKGPANGAAEPTIIPASAPGGNLFSPSLPPPRASCKSLHIISQNHILNTVLIKPQSQGRKDTAPPFSAEPACAHRQLACELCRVSATTCRKMTFSGLESGGAGPPDILHG